MGSNAVPPGWTLKQTRGTPDFASVREAGVSALRLRSNRSSFGLERSLDVDPHQFPMLTWRWKVTRLPKGGDFRRMGTDDQAAQVLVAFADRRILTYIWDSTVPRGTMQSASPMFFVHIFAVVCRSGPAEMNQWLGESRNLVEDYQRAYGHTAPRVHGIRLQINSQHTGTDAESYFSEIALKAAH